MWLAVGVRRYLGKVARYAVFSFQTHVDIPVEVCYPFSIWSYFMVSKRLWLPD